MATVDGTALAWALKSLWPQKRVEQLTYKNQPFLAMVPKDTNFRGKNRVIGVQYAPTPGRSATFTTAQANKGSHKGVAFTVTRVKDYALASIDGETFEASKGDENSLVEALDNETKAAFLAMKRSLGIALYGTGTGSIGRRASISTNAITLTDIRQVVNFEVGQVIAAGPNDSSTALRTGTSVVTAVSRQTGVVSITASDITSFADNDYLFAAGDASAKLSGLQAWLPPTAPGATSFFGVDRSVDTTRLGGVRYDASALPPSEGLVAAANAVGLEGGSPDVMFVHFDQYTNIEHDLGSKVQYDDLKVGEVGFKALLINGPTGPIKVLPDVNCPYTYGFMLQLDTWKLASIDEAPHILDLDGLKALRDYNADSIELRIGFYGQLYCDAPGWNGIITLPT